MSALVARGVQVAVAGASGMRERAGNQGWNGAAGWMQEEMPAAAQIKK